MKTKVLIPRPFNSDALPLAGELCFGFKIFDMGSGEIICLAFQRFYRVS